MVAVNLLRQARGQPLRIVLLDRSRLGRGTAYAQRDFPYPLNAPAGRMSADPAAPLEFLRFARRHRADACAGAFLPRALYGDYLKWKLSAAQRSAAPGVRLERSSREVRAVRQRDGHFAFQLELGDGRRLQASEVVLASGAPAHRELPELASLRGSSAYVPNPWRGALTIASRESILLIGTGATMADITLWLTAAAGSRVQIHALSRHGWLPTAHAVTAVREYDLDRQALAAAAASSLRCLYRLVRDAIARLQAHAGDWRAVIDGVRQSAPLIWQRLAPCERRRFLRHVRTLWDVHRHRLPPESAAALARLRAAGRLQVRAGRVIGCALERGRIQVSWRARGRAQTSVLTVDRIINCSGASYDPSTSPQPLWRGLLRQGIASSDPLALGIRTGQDGIVIDAAGQPVHGLYYLGPMLQADHWECTAVPELRGRAEALAHRLLTLHGPARNSWGLQPSRWLSLPLAAGPP